MDGCALRFSKATHRPSQSAKRLCGDLLNLRLEFLHVTANDAVDLLAILEHHEGGHSVHAQFLSDTLQLVDIDLNKTNVCVLLAQLADNGSYGLAWSTPGCEEVDDDGAGGGEGFEDDLAIGRILVLNIPSTEPRMTYLSISVTFP